MLPRGRAKLVKLPFLKGLRRFVRTTIHSRFKMGFCADLLIVRIFVGGILRVENVRVNRYFSVIPINRLIQRLKNEIRKTDFPI